MSGDGSRGSSEEPEKPNLTPASQSDLSNEPSGPRDTGGPTSARRLAEAGTFREETIERVQEELRMSRGVLTDPRSIAEYNAACPGAGMRILDEFFSSAHKQREHRESMQRRHMEAQIDLDKQGERHAERGQLMAFALAVLCLGSAVFLAHIGQPLLAGTIATTSMLSLVSAFIYGRKKQADVQIAEAKELAAKQPAPPMLPQSTTSSSPPK